MIVRQPTYCRPLTRFDAMVDLIESGAITGPREFIVTEDGNVIDFTAERVGRLIFETYGTVGAFVDSLPDPLDDVDA
jgi:hypothetical protein